jgi:hypothetical protein
MSLHVLAAATAILVLCNCGARTPLDPLTGGESQTDTRTSTTAPASACPQGCPDELSEWCVAPESLGMFINDGGRFAGQVYTASRTGTLSGVQISVKASGSGYRLRVAIRQVADGVPTRVVLGDTLLATSDSPFDSLVQFSRAIEQVAGRQYAIVVDYPDAPKSGAITGFWKGALADSNCYAGGNDVFGEDGTHWWSDGGDLHFRVFIKAK